MRVNRDTARLRFEIFLLRPNVTFEVNKLFIIWLSALFQLQARNQPLGITREYCPRISQSEHALYQLQTQAI